MLTDFDGRARLIERCVHEDARGLLSAFEFAGMPFVPRRVFTVSEVSPNVVRGGHAHRSATQILFCIQGQVEALIRFRGAEAAVTLEPKSCGLLFAAGVWCRQRYVKEHSVLLVVASEEYDPHSYLPTPS